MAGRPPGAIEKVALKKEMAAGSDNKQVVMEEIAELEALLAQVKTVGNRRDLQQLMDAKRQQVVVEDAEPATATATSPVEAPPLPQPVPVKVGAHSAGAADIGGDMTVYTEISRFGWEDEGYGKNKVTVHIMSGIDGVGEIPKENVSCQFGKDSFDLKILGLNGKNYRLVKHNLEKTISPSKSSIRIKKNRVAIVLWKEDSSSSWMNLTAKNPNKPKGVASADPSAGIMDMMKNMYDEGDEDMKRTIAKAWTESREKQGAGVGADAF